MSFTKYQSINNSYNTKIINTIKHQIHPETRFIALEKVHGANFRVTYHKHTNTVKFGKKSGYLGENESFYGHTNIKDNLERKIKLLSLDLPATSEITIHGEICGGYLEGTIKEGVKKVQGGVQYSADTEFLAFDLELDGVFVNAQKMFRLLNGVMIDVVPVVNHSCTLDEALALPLSFESLVPKKLRPKEDAPLDNIAEGIVIKPLERDIKLTNGNRLILKQKSPKFSEKGNKRKPSSKDTKLSTELVDLLSEVNAYLTVQRVECVISKEGDSLNYKDFSKIVGLFVQDAIKDFNTDSSSGDNLRNIVGDDWKPFNNQLIKEASGVLREVWLKYVEVE